MNILIDLRWMVIGRAGGMEQLAFEMVGALSKVNLHDRIYLYCPRRAFREWGIGSGNQVKPIYSDEYDLIPERHVFDCDRRNQNERSRKLGVVEKRRQLDSAETVLDIDLVHSIGGYIEISLRPYRNVVTVLDLQHAHYPEFFVQSEIEARETNHRTAIELSDRVICISKAVERDVCAHFSVAKEKMESVWVIPSSHAWLVPKESYVEKTLKHLGIAGEYIFFPSHGWPHKNHIRLVQAFAEVRKSYPNLKLVLSGGEFGSSHPAQDLIDQLKLRGAVLHLGYRTPLEIRCLLQRAKMLVYPSLFEGFGLPVAEAIVAGIPVACSNIEPLIEIGGDAVITFNPKDERDIAAKILTVANSESVRERLLDESIGRRKRFSPESIGLKTINLYRKVGGLDPIESRSAHSLASLRYEKARHGIRLFEESCDKSRWMNAIWNWILALANAPKLALIALKDRCSIRDLTDVSFEGVYGDGWIGPQYREWFMIPEGSDGIEFELGPPPEPFDKSAVFRVSIGGAAASEHRFEEGSDLKVRLRLPSNRRELIPVVIESHYSFIPKDCGFSDDSRKLSMKVLALRWR